MKELEFEWNESKAETNLRDHGVSFELAKTVFRDPFAVECIDDRHDYGEDRRATTHEQDDYFQQNA